MATFEEIEEARRMLSLPESASMREIKQAYRKMSFQYHPDRRENGQESEEVMKRINWAYKLVMDYCRRYKYTFREEDVDRAYPEEWNRKRYAEGWFHGFY